MIHLIALHRALNEKKELLSMAGLMDRILTNMSAHNISLPLRAQGASSSDAVS